MKISKEQIVIELLEEEQISPEEAAILLDRPGEQVILKTTYELEYIDGEELEVKDNHWTTTST
tara:strand:+ start:1995 stop:2183 length:189 start_codon:yes stop_codon:yes gene_type:complete